MIAEIVKLTHLHLTDELSDLYLQLSPTPDDPIVTDCQRREWFSRLSEKGDEVFVYLIIRPKRGDATSFETLIGGVGTLVYDEKLIHGRCTSAHIEDVVVREDLRGRGIGKSLVDHLVRQARTRNCYKVSLVCKPEIEEFYAGRGFKNEGSHMAIRL